MENDYYPSDETDIGDVLGYETSTDMSNYTNSMMLQDSQRQPFGMIMSFLLLFLFVMVSMYVYYALSFQRMARKINIPDDWHAWVPILNIVLLFKIANRPLWWMALLIIPGVNVVISVIVWMDVAKAMGKPEWWGILTIVPVVNLIVPGYLAFSAGAVPVYDAKITPIKGNEDAFVYNTTVMKNPEQQPQKKHKEKQAKNQLEQDLERLQQKAGEKKD